MSAITPQSAAAGDLPFPPPVGRPSPDGTPPPVAPTAVDPRPPGEVGPERGSRWRKMVAAFGAIVVVGVSLAFDREPIGVVVALFVLVVPFEKMFPRHRQKVRRPLLGTDLAHALASPLMTGIGIVAGAIVGVVSLAWLPGLALRPLVGLIPSSILPLVGIVLFDMVIYWTHRWYHEVPFLWRFHAIHHSTEHLDWISGFRNHPFDGTLIAPAFIFLLAAGFDAEFTGILAVIQIVLGIFLHANVRWRLRWLHKLVITPEFHHWHHANEAGAINSNYSVFLPLWDLVFGTYFMPADRRPTRYGVSEPIPETMVAQLWHPMRGMGNPLGIVRHPIRSVRALARFVRRLGRDLLRSATRPRNVAPGPAPTQILPIALVPTAARPAEPRSLAQVMGWDETRSQGRHQRE